jgi:uncharacterized protein YkwD
MGALLLRRTVLATAAAFGVFAGLVSFTPAANAGDPCHRYGDTQPDRLGGKEATNAVVCLINKQRNEHGRGDLDRDGRLIGASRKHSSRMADHGCFAHRCPGERDVLPRLQAVKYIVGGLSRWAYGENIGWGTRSQGTPRQIVNAWMNSSYHRANMLSGTFQDVGVGYARHGDKGYFTADFGLRSGWRLRRAGPLRPFSRRS